jgi:glucokinase
LQNVGLVADIGGTNTRLGLVTAGSMAGVMRFENAAHAQFVDVLDAYASAVDLRDVGRAALAVAGPVSPEQGELTNRDWVIPASAVAARLGGAEVHLVNDLAALGLSVAELDPTQWDPVSDRSSRGDQTLVLGFGTGLNVGFVLGGRAAYTELGHAGLPARAARLLTDAIGTAATTFLTVEDVVSGRGFPDVYRAMTGEGLPLPQIAARAEAGDGQARNGLVLLARLAGTVAMEVSFSYMPTGGLYLAGSVARQLCQAPYRDHMVAAFRAEDSYRDMIEPIPLRLIKADEAALIGLARLLRDSH